MRSNARHDYRVTNVLIVACWTTVAISIYIGVTYVFPMFALFD